MGAIRRRYNRFVFMEMYAMNMINTVVNGYITVIVLILFLAFTVRLRVLSHWLEFCFCTFCTCWKSKAGKMHLFIRKHRMIW